MFWLNMFANMFEYHFSVITINKPTVVQEIQENCFNPKQS